MRKESGTQNLRDYTQDEEEHWRVKGCNCKYRK